MADESGCTTRRVTILAAIWFLIRHPIRAVDGLFDYYGD